MFRAFVALFVVLLLSVPHDASAQIGQGSLRGYVKDQQGGALPSAVVTATSPEMLSPSTATTDGDGFYRILNLPPGTYILSVDLQGFSPHRQEGILLRGGANFQVDVELRIGTLAETGTVAGESPMLEVTRPGNVLNIDGEFQKNHLY